MDAHYADKINVENIAEEAFCSKFYFIRLFKKIYGHTPHQYLTAVRVDRAKALLRQNYAAADVCYQVGFESVSSFKALFKKYAGTTPTDFRNRHLQHQREVQHRPTRYIPGCFATKNGLSAE